MHLSWRYYSMCCPFTYFDYLLLFIYSFKMINCLWYFLSYFRFWSVMAPIFSVLVCDDHGIFLRLDWGIGVGAELLTISGIFFPFLNCQRCSRAVSLSRHVIVIHYHSWGLGSQTVNFSERIGATLRYLIFSLEVYVDIWILPKLSRLIFGWASLAEWIDSRALSYHFDVPCSVV